MKTPSQSDPSTLSPQAKRLGLIVAGVFLILGAALWWGIAFQSEQERPTVYGVQGTHPGDLVPGLSFQDNLKHYGIDVDWAYSVKTNRLGFRGVESPVDGGPVVLVVGDSFVFGMGVDTEETFPAQLEAQLRTDWPKTVVHNAGVPGYTIVDQREHWKHKLHTIRPDIVLLCHTASDLKEMSRPTSFRRMIGFDDESPSADAELTEMIKKHGGDKRAFMESEYLMTQDALLEKLGRLKAHGVLTDYRTAYIDQLAAFAKEVRSSQNAPAFGVVFWVDGYGMLQLNAAPVQQALRERGIPYFDGDRALRSQKEIAPEELFLPDNHFTAKGNELAATQTTDWLKKHPLLRARLIPQ